MIFDRFSHYSNSQICRLQIALLLLVSGLLLTAKASANLRCDQALFSEAEEVIPFKSRAKTTTAASETSDKATLANQWLSHEQIFEQLTKSGLAAKAALASPDPKLAITSFDLVSLKRLLDLTAKSRLRQNLKTYQKFAYYRAVESIEELILQQLRMRTEYSLPYVADDLVSSLHRTLTLKGLYLSKAEREDYARLIGKVLCYLDGSVLDAIGVYKDIRYLATYDEARFLIANLKATWVRRPLKLSDIETFANLTAVVPFISVPNLSHFANLYHRNLNAHNPAAIQGYSVFLWSLVQVNPALAYQFASRIIHNFPDPLSEKMGIFRYNQLAFANAYFKYVLKTPIPWLVELQHRLQSFDKIARLKTSQDQEAIGPILKQHFPVLLEEHRIPETPFVADFYVPDQKLIIELDGDVHFNIKASGKDKARRKDIRKDEILKAMGYQVIHFTNEEAKQIRDEIMSAEFTNQK